MYVSGVPLTGFNCSLCFFQVSEQLLIVTNKRTKAKEKTKRLIGEKVNSPLN